MLSLLQSLLQGLPLPRDSSPLEGAERVWEVEISPLVDKGVVQEHLSGLNAHKSMGPDGMHPRVLRELTGVIAKPLSIIFERSWRTGEVPEDWRIANVTLVFRRARRRIQETTGESVSPLSLERCWNSLFWMPPPRNWKRRRS